MKWNGDRMVAKVRAQAERRLDAARFFLQGEVRKLISVPSRTVAFQKGRDGKYRKVLGRRGSDRSKPGEPPHKDHGTLRASISSDREGLIARVGSPLKVARWLELGTTGGTIIKAKNAKVLSDGVNFFGREVKQGPIAPRPFLRKALAENRQAILDILRHGSAIDIQVGNE